MDAAQTCIITPDAIEMLVMRQASLSFMCVCVGVGVMSGAVVCARCAW